MLIKRHKQPMYAFLKSNRYVTNAMAINQKNILIIQFTKKWQKYVGGRGDSAAVSLQFLIVQNYDSPYTKG